MNTVNVDVDKMLASADDLERLGLMVKARILVVEDEINLLTGIRDILELENFQVLTAQNGQDGLTVLRSNPNNPPDVIVSDVMMPHMDGWEFLEAVRKEDRWVTIPFIFLTARGEKEDQYRGAKLGADRYLIKPFDAEELVVAVEAALDRQNNIKRVHTGVLSDVKRQILTILNHEFRTPLTLVVAYADMLRDSDPSDMSDAELMTFLHGVNSGAARLRRLIENFILLVELDSGDAYQNFGWRGTEITDVRDYIRDAHQQAAGLYKRDYRLDIPERVPKLKVDTQFLMIAVRELLVNAAKFSTAEGRVALRVYLDDQHLCVEVEDNGRGIPEHELEKIWERFYQINRELYEDQGAGSGLAIVDGIINLHNGKRMVSSQVGAGSTFTICFPLLATEGATATS